MTSICGPYNLEGSATGFQRKHRNRSLSSARMCTPHVHASVHMQNEYAFCNIQSRHTRPRPTLPRSGPTCVATRLSFRPRFAQNG
jgi:hypothetical protein